MDALEVLKTKLLKYPDLPNEQNEKSLSIMPEGGFTVSFHENETGYTVGYEGWHEDFSNADEALDCFAFEKSSCHPS